MCFVVTFSLTLVEDQYYVLCIPWSLEVRFTAYIACESLLYVEILVYCIKCMYVHQRFRILKASVYRSMKHQQHG